MTRAEELGGGLASETLSLGAALRLLGEGLSAAEREGPAAQVSEEEIRGPVRPLVLRRCPYCHDGLAGSEQVLCALCATPHHAACFQEHSGCSLLGCESKRSFDLQGPASRVICGSCSELRPANATFCSKCGVVAETAPERATPARACSFVQAAGLLLVVAFAGGAILGGAEARGRRIELELALEAGAAREEARVKEHLRAIQRAQRALDRYDLDPRGADGSALSVDDLDEILSEALRSTDEVRVSEASRALEDLRLGPMRVPGWRIRIGRDRAGREVATASRKGLTWTCDLEGRITHGHDESLGRWERADQ